MNSQIKKIPDVDCLKYKGTTDNPDIKIFVSNRIDLDSVQIDNPLYIPVRCGAVFDNRENVKMLGDDTGDNISNKKDYYSELTVMYWAWKNIHADYYGLCHYRRYLSFSSEHFSVEENSLICPTVIEENLTDESQKKYCLYDNVISKELTLKDGIICDYIDITKLNNPFGKKAKSIYERCLMCEGYKFTECSVNALFDIIKKEKTEFYEFFVEYMNGKDYIGYNCFILKKSIFQELSEFVFDVLFKLESVLTDKLERSIGYLGEILIGAYLFFLKNIKNKCIETRQLVFFKNTEEINPKWEESPYAICVSSSNEYSPYLYVYLKNLISHSVSKKDIIVFERDISDENKRRINTLVNNDVCIRFINPSYLFNSSNLYISHDYFKEECYYRIAAPLLLKNYKKIIFTDLDLLVFDDISILNSIDLEGKIIAACIEPVWKIFCDQDVQIKGVSIREYSKNILQLSEPYSYYNTGVVVIDVQQFNKADSFKKLLEIVNNNKLLYQEQCALNILFKNNFYTLPSIWNFELLPMLKDYVRYSKDESEAKVIHYLGGNKPWKNCNEYKADLWWNIARDTPFYEEIYFRMNYYFFNAIPHPIKQSFISLLKIKLKNEVINRIFPFNSKRRIFLKKALEKLSII